MSSRSFRSVFMVASCAGAALSCYLVSLRVASERAALEDVETKIVLAQRDMRVLQTEIGTRGRLSQLERWNTGAFALSAPAAGQFLKGGFEIARLAQPERKPDFQAPVVLAAAPAPASKPPVGSPETDDFGAHAAITSSALLHEASLKTETREVPARTVVLMPLTTARSTDKPAIAAKPAQTKSVEKPGLAAAQAAQKTVHKPEPKQLAAAVKPATKKSVDKPVAASAKAVTKPVRLARIDPLAPLSARHSSSSKDSTADR
ncbi:MAG: hypothetical protein ACJ8FO_10720 [Sphingomicrobium sp.]